MALNALEGEGLRVLAELRAQAELISPRLLEARPRRVLPTGLDALDGLIGGGLPRGRLIETTGNMGRTAVALAVTARTTQAGQLVAYIDAASALGAREAARAGVVLERLLVVRPAGLQKALAAAEVALAAGLFPLVVVDLSGLPAQQSRGYPAQEGQYPRRFAKSSRVPDGAWVRLSRVAERADAVALLIGGHRRTGTFAALTVELRCARPEWNGRGPHAVLGGAVIEAAVVRSKLGPSGGQASFTLGLSG